jgi:hypothetical protein
MTEIIEKLNIPITDKSEIPSGFAALTFPIELDQEEIIRSIWSTLRTTEALVTQRRPGQSPKDPGPFAPPR